MIDIRFEKYKSLKEVEGMIGEGAVNATGCADFVSFEGHNPHQTRINAGGTGVTSLNGLKEGLHEIFLDGALSLKSPVGLPASCQIAFFNNTLIEHLYSGNQKMTEGLRVLSLSSCKELKDLKGMPNSCLSLYINETNLKSFEGMTQNVECVSSAWCPCLETTKGLSAKCKKLNLDWSGIKRLEDIPETIQEIRVYGCSNLDTECFHKLPVSVLPKIKGLVPEQQKIVDTIYTKKHRVAYQQPEIPVLSCLTLVRA